MTFSTSLLWILTVSLPSIHYQIVSSWEDVVEEGVGRGRLQPNHLPDWGCQLDHPQEPLHLYFGQLTAVPG